MPNELNEHGFSLSFDEVPLPCPFCNELPMENLMPVMEDLPEICYEVECRNQNCASKPRVNKRMFMPDIFEAAKLRVKAVKAWNGRG